MNLNTTAMNLKPAYLSILLVPLLLCFALIAPSARAAVEGPPAYIDYQGMVFDGTDTDKPLGSTLTNGNYIATPTNYTMVFRIYNEPGQGTLIWGETQTVTVSLGAFSVRLGSGAPIVGEPVLDLAQAFDSSARYLELTVVPPGGDTSSTPISPRLAFQTSPFAFVAGRARVADSVNGGGTFSGGTFSGSISAADSTINGGTYSGGTFSGGTFSGSISAAVGTTITGGTYSEGTYSGNGAGLGSLDAANISTGVLSDSRLSNNVIRGNTRNNFIETQSFQDIIVDAKGENGSVSISPGLRFGDNESGSAISSHRDTNNATGKNPNGLDFWTDSKKRMSIDSAGRVSIGTSAFTHPLLVYGSGPQGKTSIWAEGAVAGTTFLSSSDRRIKVVDGRSDGVVDLDKLLKIEITDYRIKDLVGKDNRQHKMAIAQQVEQIYPQAVTQTIGVVPDIFEQAPIKDGWIELKTDLNVGERVRLTTEEGYRAEHVVLETEDGFFRTDFTEDCSEIFVYGREVDDFRSVDYAAIAMLNVSATQELARKLEAKDAQVAALQSENTDLKERLAALEANEKGRDAKLAAIEKMLSSGQTNGTVVPVSATAGAQ